MCLESKYVKRFIYVGIWEENALIVGSGRSSFMRIGGAYILQDRCHTIPYICVHTSVCVCVCGYGCGCLEENQRFV